MLHIGASFLLNENKLLNQNQAFGNVRLALLGNNVKRLHLILDAQQKKKKKKIVQGEKKSTKILQLGMFPSGRVLMHHIHNLGGLCWGLRSCKVNAGKRNGRFSAVGERSTSAAPLLGVNLFVGNPWPLEISLESKATDRNTSCKFESRHEAPKGPKLTLCCIGKEWLLYFSVCVFCFFLRVVD